MRDTLNKNQTFSTPSEAMAHYGVKGMRWGVRKTDAPGVSRKINKDAKKDAEEFARAKMFYGQGAGTRRKLIKNSVEAKSKKSAEYKKAFDHHLAQQDMSKHSSKAVSERKRKDRTETVVKTSRGVNRQLNGGFGPVSVSAAVIAAGVVAARKNNIDQILRDSAATQYRSRQSSRQNRRAAEDLLRDMGMR